MGIDPSKEKPDLGLSDGGEDEEEEDERPDETPEIEEDNPEDMYANL